MSLHHGSNRWDTALEGLSAESEMQTMISEFWDEQPVEREAHNAQVTEAALAAEGPDLKLPITEAGVVLAGLVAVGAFVAESPAPLWLRIAGAGLATSALVSVTFGKLVGRD